MDITVFDVIYLALALWGVYAVLTMASATDNRRGYNKPHAVAWDYSCIPFATLKKVGGVEVVGIDLDRTLCRLGFLSFFSKPWLPRFLRTETELPRKAEEFLYELHHKHDLYVLIITKSNKNVAQMYRNMGSPEWMSYMVTSKSSPSFMAKLNRRIDGQISWVLSPGYKMAMVGDKLSDMGPPNRPRNFIIGILTNPQGGHDIFTENFPALRRWHENVVLRQVFKIKRASRRGEYTWLG